MRTLLHKLSVEKLVIEQDVGPYAKAWYIKATTASLIMSGPTGQAAWIAYQLMSCLAMRIG